MGVWEVKNEKSLISSPSPKGEGCFGGIKGSSQSNTLIRLDHCIQTARTILLNGWSYAFEQQEQCFRTTKAML